MPKMTMEEFLGRISVDKSPLAQGNPDKSAIAAQVKTVLEEKLPFLKEAENKKALLENLWDKPSNSLTRIENTEGKDPYEVIAEKIMEGSLVVLPLAWNDGREGPVSDTNIYGGNLNQEDMFILCGGQYQDNFYLQAMDRNEAIEISNLRCPLKRPGFWDKVVDFIKSMFNSRDTVCAQWDDYYNFDRANLANSTTRTKYMMRDDGMEAMARELKEPRWDVNDPDKLWEQLQNRQNTEPINFNAVWGLGRFHIYSNLLLSVQKAACQEIIGKGEAFVKENAKEICALMKDLKAYVVENVTEKDIQKIQERDERTLGKFEKFGQTTYKQYKKDVASAVKNDKETLRESGPLKHQEVKQINKVTSV